jgi:murein DD-endopeptidase MepM/ murein hydrolase activator NlpD
MKSLTPGIGAACVSWCVFVLAGGTSSLTLQQGDPSITVSTWARAFRPGEVVLVTVRARQPLAHVEATAFDRPVTFWPDQASNSWQTLTAIPLETKPGGYTITMRARDAGGAVTSADARIDVVAHVFETRRLQVDPRFVTPPASESARIEREAKQLAALFEQRRPARLWQGAFVRPVSTASNSSFGRLSVFNGKPAGRHQGADFQAKAGTPVVAPNAGVIVLASEMYYSGTTVVVDHGEGLFSLMAHLSRVAVAVGATVAKGDRLGDAGATGRVTGPHLHWAVRLLGVSVDPLSLIAATDAIHVAPIR